MSIAQEYKAASHGYFRNAEDLAEIKNLTDQQKTNLLISMRDTLEKKIDGKYEFTIFRNGFVLDSPGNTNPSVFIKKGNSIEADPGTTYPPGKVVPFFDFRDIAAATYGILSSGKIPANELTFVLRRIEQKPAESQPAESQPAESQPAESQPATQSAKHGNLILFGIFGAIAGKILGKTSLASAVGAGSGVAIGYLLREEK